MHFPIFYVSCHCLADYDQAGPHDDDNDDDAEWEAFEEPLPEGAVELPKKGVSPSRNDWCDQVLKQECCDRASATGVEVNVERG